MKLDMHSDNRYLEFTFDTQTGIDVLNALRGLGYEKVSLKLMLSFALSRIEHRREKISSREDTKNVVHG